MENKKQYWYIGFIVIFAFILYYPTIQYGLTNWDDPHGIKENLIIRSLSFGNLQHIFTEPYFNNYNPILYLSYAIEYHFVGLNPSIIHASNVLLFLLNIVLVYRFIHLLSGKKEVAIVASILFAVHPTRVEPVTWAITRSYLLYLTFFLLALIQYMKYLKEVGSRKSEIRISNRNYYLSILFFVLSCISKSSAISLSLILIFIDYLFERKIDRNSILDKIPFFVISIFFGIVAILVVKADNTTDLYSLIERVQFGGYAILFYFNKFFFPVHLSAFYPYSYASGSLPFYWWIFPILVILLSGIILYTGKFTRKIIFGLGFFFSSILLMLQFFAVGNCFAADRYIYVPFLGLFYLAGEGYYFIKQRVASFKGGHLLLNGTLGVIILLLSYVTHERIKIWKNSITLWTDVIENYPGKHQLPYYNRGCAARDMKDNEQAINDYTSSIGIQPTTEAFNNRGSLKSTLNDNEGAIQDFDKAIEIKPFADAYANRSLSFSVEENFPQALKDINLAIQLDKRYDFIYGRGLVYYFSKSIKAAAEDFAQVIKLAPDNASAYYFLGNCEFLLKDMDAACNYWNNAKLLGNVDASLAIEEYCLGKSKLKSNPKTYYKTRLPNGQGKVKLEIVQEGDKKILKHYAEEGYLQEAGVIDSSGKYNGEFIQYYKSGKINVQGFYKAETPYGAWKEYYENGKLMASYNYVSGQMNGSYKYYYDNGQLWTERIYKEGKLLEAVANNNIKGTPLNKGSLKNGNGTLNVYGEEGKLLETINYVGGFKIK